MNINVIETFDQFKNRSVSKFTFFLDKVSKDRKITRQNKKEQDDTKELLSNLNKARNEWIMANANYEFAHDDELIDYYTYLIKASQIKYNYLLKKIKEKGSKLQLNAVYNLETDKEHDFYNNLK